MKKVTIGGLILLSIGLSACHSTTESDIQTSDSTQTLFEKLDSITPLDSVHKVDSSIIVDTIKK